MLCGPMRVLVVEDHTELAESVVRVLRRDGIAADVAPDGEEALRRAGVVDYDVVVLDRDLPACTATRSAARWWRGAAERRC
jgi:DNA-binding response OmpR family regulator